MHKGENSGNATRVGLTGLTGLIRLARTVDRINEQIGLTRLLTWKDELWRTRLAWEAGLPKARGGGGQEIGRRKMCCLKQEASSAVVPVGYYQDTKMSVAEVMTKIVGRKERGGGLGLLV
jgi:hypothetical protein